MEAMEETLIFKIDRALGALDALHVAAAKISGAEEFVTTERPTTALFRVVGITVTTIR
jgi:predicted nucleic acid-binding protein